MKSKKDFQQLFLNLIEPLKSHYSDGCATLNLGATSAGYGNRIAGMEGFSRVLWGLVPYWAGGGENDGMHEIYIKGITNGTDPSHPEYWGDIHARDQRMVEMAALSLGILLTPERIWEPLSEQAKDNFASWLYQINEYPLPDCNWQFFNVMVNMALKSVGKKFSQECVDYAISRFEAYYIDNGWYCDGERPQKDYYISFAIQFYCLIYSHFMKDDDPERCALYRERAAKFAETFIYWFDDEGKALPYGRSQTYRFAQAAFWSACVLCELDVFDTGILRGIIERHLDYWLALPIFDNGGVLTVGYAYPNLHMAEGYNAPGSPYWSFKTFAFLAMPDDHPFWHTEPSPLPQLDAVKQIPECNMVISHRAGEVTALTAGQYCVVNHTHNAAKYSKFAYSSRFGFSVPRDSRIIEENAPDSMLAFFAHDTCYVRRQCDEVRFENNTVYSKWRPVDGIVVETTLIPTENGHIRRHTVTSELDCTAYECGFAYPNCMELSENEFGGGFAEMRDKNGFSRVDAVGGTGKILWAAPNTNMIFPNTGIPCVVYEIKKGTQTFEARISTQFTKTGIKIGSGNCYE